MIIWAGAMRPKIAKKPKKLSVTNGQTNGPTDQQTDEAGCRVAWHATKKRKRVVKRWEKVEVKRQKGDRSRNDERR